MIKKIHIRLLFVLFVVMCVSSNLKAQDEPYYPILKLDINNQHITAETEPNFVSFTLADSGSVVDGITVEFTAGSLDSRRRNAPTGIPFEQIYRDFVFSRPGGMTITLSGLVPNQIYEITIYAYDTGSAGDRIADWTANGDFIFTTSFNGGVQPTSAYSHASWGETTPDSTGTIVLECGPNPETIEESGASNPYGFINGLEIYSPIPVKIARRPRPDEGALLSGTSVNLTWLPGGYAVAHDVYLGDNLDDVNAATNSGPMGLGEIYKAHVDDANSYTVNDLIPGTTYYWRVDEVNNVYPDSPWKGDIWSFTVSSKSAYQPIPVDTSLFVDPNVTLSWAAGTGAQSHHVYLGDNLEDVQAGTGGTDKGAVTEPNYSPPGLLEREKTYYWRVDEFDGVETHTGDVWSFTTTLEGLGTVVFDIWEDIAGSDLNDLTANGNYPDNPTRSEEITLFSIGIEPAGSSYDDNYGGRIHGWLYVPMTGDYTFFFTSADQGQLWLSTDDDPTNVQLLAAEPVWGWFNAFNRKSDPIPLIGGERYYIMAIWKEAADWDHCQAAWQGPGIPNMEIIQGSYLAPYNPVNAYGPTPEDGGTYINQTPILYWHPGKYAASHNIFFGSDPNALDQIATISAGQEKYGPLAPPLDVNVAYYWRVDEVNNLSPDSPWTGSVWSFTTADYIVVDDFEDYNDYAPDRIFDVWGDFFVNNTGMTVGHFDPPFAERTIINRGSQAMYMRYDNDGTVNEDTIYEQTGTLLYSEAEREWTDAQDWTAKGATSLSLWFRGILASDGSFTEGPPITMTSRSEDIVDEADSFHFAYKRLSGEGSITARVVSITAVTDDPNDNPAPAAKAGIMIRESLEPGSTNAAMVVTFGSGVNFQYRSEANAGTEVTTEAGITAPQWVRLTRSGNTFTGQYSADGNTWTTLGSVDIPMLLDIYVGLCLASDNIDAVCAAEFSNVTTSGTGDWQSQDIGIESNIAEQLYVVLEDSAGNSAVVVNPDPAATTIDVYTQWSIPLTDFTGVNLQAIKKMSIGVGSRGSTQLGSAGDLYIDDIGLQIPVSEQ